MSFESIFLFTNNLRICDNSVFVKAIESSNKVLPVYIFDKEMLSKKQYNSHKMGLHRYRFLLESLHNLKENLNKIGADLWYYEGKAEHVLAKLKTAYGIHKIFIQEEPGIEEKTLIEKLKLLGFTVTEVPPSNLLQLSQLPFTIAQLPPIFTVFRTKIEVFVEVNKPLPNISTFDLPTNISPPNPLPDIPKEEKDKRSAFPFEGGETQALKRLQNYFFETKSIYKYKETRNELIGSAYSSKFSPWLANGNLSARYIFNELLELEYTNGQILPEEISRKPIRKTFNSESTYWLVFELLWREFFRLTAYKHGANLFKKEGILKLNKQYKNDYQVLEKWKNGKTEDAFVNANMRELQTTGFMSNRGRQNVASYLVHDLGIDWRWGAAWFEEMLIDYDPYSNWGNWQYIAGVGNDPRFRKFNTLLQADRYDAKEMFRKMWT